MKLSEKPASYLYVPVVAKSANPRVEPPACACATTKAVAPSPSKATSTHDDLGEMSLASPADGATNRESRDTAHLGLLQATARRDVDQETRRLALLSLQ